MTGNELKIAAKNSELPRLKNFFINSPPSLTGKWTPIFMPSGTAEIRLVSAATLTCVKTGQQPTTCWLFVYRQSMLVNHTIDMILLTFVIHGKVYLEWFVS